MIFEEAQFLLDNYNLINPNAITKPFCVPGILVFSDEMLRDVEDYNYELENVPKKILPEDVERVALNGISLHYQENKGDLLNEKYVQ